MKQIAKALVEAQKNFAPALKTQTNPHFKSKYVGLDGCVEAVIDALNAQGIMLMQPSHECDDGVLIETLFIHESGETMSSGKLHVPADKKSAQGYGSALTYARRYSLMAACGIAPEDDDGNAATNTHGKEEKVKPSTQKTQEKKQERDIAAELRSCVNIDDLKKVFSSLTKEEKVEFEALKNELKDGMLPF